MKGLILCFVRNAAVNRMREYVSETSAVSDSPNSLLLRIIRRRRVQGIILSSLKVLILRL